jgi:hypothetical protein
MPENRRATLERRSAEMDVDSLVYKVFSKGNLKEGEPYIIEGRRKKEVVAED